jgi:hypothetical protein
MQGLLIHDKLNKKAQVVGSTRTILNGMCTSLSTSRKKRFKHKLPILTDVIVQQYKAQCNQRSVAY